MSDRGRGRGRERGGEGRRDAGAPRVYCLVNGINTFPGESKNWNGRGVTWIHTHTPARAEKIEYFCGAIGRAFGQVERARKLYRTLSFYDLDWDKIVVGHSNGAAVALKMLRDYQANFPPIAELHLVCAAAESDFEKNGLNRWLRSGRVGRVYVFMALEDRALRLAHTCWGRWLGYGSLGLEGPKNVGSEVAGRVQVIRWPGFGHSSCWGERAFSGTMKQLMV